VERQQNANYKAVSPTAAAANAVGLVMEMAGRVARMNYQLVDIRRVEVKDTGLAGMNLDERMRVRRHRRGKLIHAVNKHRDAGMRKHRHCVAAEQSADETGAGIRAHHDQIAALLLCLIHNGFVRMVMNAVDRCVSKLARKADIACATVHAKDQYPADGIMEAAKKTTAI
jgi:hypothetical protein